MAEDPSPDSSDAAENSAPPTSKRRARRTLLFAGVAVAAIIAGSITVILYAGSSADDGSLVSLKLGTYPQSAGGVRSSSFVGVRSLNGNLVADSALLEDSPEGPLPVIGRNGRTALAVYALPFNAQDKRPRIAIVIGGLAVGASTTDRALSLLPAPITLAFAPFAPNLQDIVDKARLGGHEVLLEVPMEPFDFPDSDPGPHALLAAATSDDNIKRLTWSLSRFTGYVGVTNLLGGRFLGETAAVEPVLAEVTKRGLLFFDDGASSSSVVGTAARHLHTDFAVGTMQLDTVQTAAAIDKKLADLETEARTDGVAIGVGSAYPVTLARVADWAANAEARGFAIAPISAVAKQPDADTGDASQPTH